MSAQPSTELHEPPIWSGWQNAVINGVYPLHRLLQGSQHSAVFLTERKDDQVVTDAALKIIPIDRVTLAQLSHWRGATALSHPHLIQLFDAGLCHLGGRQYLFVVMEYAQQSLSSVLARRALTEEEVRELLPPTLDALGFLHRQNLVLANLKPSNVLVVDDQLKLASDGIRPNGAPRVDVAEASFYDAPEASRAPFSPADDLWRLGVTLTEALTQRIPGADERSTKATLPDSFPAAFVDTVQLCLSPNPEARPAIRDMQRRFGGAQDIPAVAVAAAPAPEAPIAPAAPVPETVAPEAPAVADVAAEHPTPLVVPPALMQESPVRRGRMTAIVAGVGVVLLASVGIALLSAHGHRNALPVAPVPEQQSTQPPATVPAVTSPTTPAPSTGPVVHRQLPQVSRSSLATIHGTVKVLVVAVVDRTGAVVDAHFKNAGPSAYFAGRAREAARKWRFAPTSAAGRREWQLRFEFTRGGITADAQGT